jgi:soluble lytic murein transglycosylase-like protein
MPLALPYLACMLQAAQYYALPPRVLPSIQAVEGGAPGTVHRNSDGSLDLGVMQVNTLWVGPIANRIHETPAAVQARLTNDACFNIAAAALILRGYLNESHDLLEAVGDYHSHTKLLNLAYRSHVVAVAAAMFGGQR